MEDSTYRFGEYSISLAERRLSRNGKCVTLSPKSFDGLYLLVRNHGSLVSREEMTRTLWPGIHVSEANLTNIIVQLRKVLGRDSIETVSKFGYRFTLQVTGEPGIKQIVYASFVRGKELVAERSIDSLQRARELFWLCIAENPQFASGWAWFGRTCRVLDKFKGGQPSAPNLAEAAFRRAFALDPDLACAHHFYTQIQVDSGRAEEAMMRLASRLKKRGEDPETLAGLVQVLRCCGLLDESVAAHHRVIALDSTMRTSVAHTLFLQCEYAAVFEHYVGKGFYLDAASWAALGQKERAALLLRTRLGEGSMGPLMTAMLASLLAVLEGKSGEAVALIEKAEVVQEPEALFYFARHCGMVNAGELAVSMIRRARLAGFWSSRSLERDPAFDGIRGQPEFRSEIRDSQMRTEQAYQALREVSDLSFAR